MNARRRLFAGAVATALLATACSEAGQPLAPSTPTLQTSNASENLLGGLIGGVTSALTDLLFPPVKRTTPLAQDVVWSFNAGPGGASSYNSAVGLKITIPSGALASDVKITVTALAGSPIAYRFEPHLEFAKPVTLTQSLKGTNASLLSVMSGAHFDGDYPDYTTDGLVKVVEAVLSVNNLLSNTTSFKVSHFSGWILVSGCKDESQ